LYHVWLVDTGNVAVVARAKSAPLPTMENQVQEPKSVIVIVAPDRAQGLRKKKEEVDRLVLAPVLPNIKKNEGAKMNNVVVVHTLIKTGRTIYILSSRLALYFLFLQKHDTMELRSLTKAKNLICTILLTK